MADPLKYFRVEAREILDQLQSGLLELERGQATGDAVARLLRLAHTLKGAARVVRQLEIASLAHQLEELLLPFRAAVAALSREEGERLLAVVDGIALRVGSLTSAVEAPAPDTAQTPAASTPQVKSPTQVSDEPPRAAPLEHVESLMDSVAELGFQLGSARQALSQLAQCRDLDEMSQLEREISTSLERATRELGQVRDRVDQLRLVTAGSMFGALERTTRDAAVSSGKQAVFEGRGGEVRLDADVLSAVQRALLQAVRNAVAHGIESSADRSARGKPSQGRVLVDVVRRGRHISFVCRDDGRGVNLADVQREAERLGKVAKTGAAPTSDDLLSLLLRGGISTSPAVTQLAGRGVGLDLIREALASVGGTVALSTEAGAGTSLELRVRASLSALDALVVEAGGELCAIPLASVVQARRLAPGDLNRTAESASVLFEDHVVPFFPLAWLIKTGRHDGREQKIWSTVIVRGQAGLLALGVERLLGAESLVARSLPDSVEVDETVAGVTLDADGNPRLLLDPDGLLEAATKGPRRPPQTTPRQRSILVVDDSLTTRMLEQSILESAGYAVELATSGEQGLEKARERSYDLFLVDVEMPGMDGFTFIELVRADPRLSATPAVLVTSRASASDLARGRAVGAKGHIAKGEFDQLAFLEQIGRLMR